MNDIVILGAGYAGMMAAARLDRISEPFTLVNKHDYHYFTTLLHEAAGGRAKPEKYAVSIRKIVRKSSSELVHDEIVSIDRERRVVHGRSGEYPYQYLAFALGNAPEYFGIPGLAEHSLVLRSLNSAASIRARIEGQFRAYLEDHDPSHLRIVVGGAGLTGIELVGELLDWLPKLCLHHGIEPAQVDIQNIEAMPMILPQLSAALRAVAVQTLTEKGAKLRINTKIVKVEAGVVHLDGGESVAAGTIVWTGGVRANPLLEKAGFTVDRRGRAKVNAYLQSVDDERIFIGGDSAWFEDSEGKPIPPTGQAATQMGKLIADNISSLAHGQLLKPFYLSWKGTLASLGREAGVGDVGGMQLKGFVGGLAKEATKVKYLWDLGGVRLAGEKSGQLLHL